jgi:steroid delta-isomerase-like uncharacterized protein
MQKSRKQWAVVLLCSAVTFGWGTDKSPQKEGNEQNTGVVRQVFADVASKGNFELVNQIYAPNCVVHHRNKTMSLNEAISDAREWRSAAPDMVFTVEKIEGARDHVTVHWIARGTNTGQGHGLTASGKPIVVRGNTEFRFANGKIAEQWDDFNDEEIFKQAGQSPRKR